MRVLIFESGADAACCGLWLTGVHSPHWPALECVIALMGRCAKSCAASGEQGPTANEIGTALSGSLGSTAIGHCYA